MVICCDLAVVFRVEVDDGITAATTGFNGYILALFQGEEDVVFVADRKCMLLRFTEYVSGCLRVCVVGLKRIGLWTTAAAGAAYICFIGTVVTLR